LPGLFLLRHTRREFLAVAAAAAAAGQTAADPAFLDDLRQRAFRFFVEHADPDTGLMCDRAHTDGTLGKAHYRDARSIASNGFGLTGLCIGAEHGWIPRTEARQRILTSLRFFANAAPGEHGWFYHFMTHDGKRMWKSELSSIDTALLLAGILTARQYFAGDPEIASLANTIWGRVDFQWMLNGDKYLLAMGWHPESGFINARWDHYCELMILYLLAIASPAHAIPADAWYAWSRPVIEYAGYKYIYGDRPLFVHQYAHAWIDFRARKEARPPHIDWFQNSITATLAQRAYCISLTPRFHAYSETVWGITASDSAHGYIAWGGPPPDPRVDGTVVPCAPGGSLMFTPAYSVPALQTMKRLYGDRVWGHYGFADAFNPNTGWVDGDVIGIDLGITLLSAENLVGGNVWKWFMSAPEVQDAMKRVGLG